MIDIEALHGLSESGGEGKGEKERVGGWGGAELMHGAAIKWLVYSGKIQVIAIGSYEENRLQAQIDVIRYKIYANANAW
jgi:hypothetical protein